MAVTQEAIDKAIEISKEYDVSKLILFGSSLENLETANDLDLACESALGWNFFEYAAKLDEELDVKVDIIPLDNDSRFANYIRKVGKVIYEKRKSN